MSEDKPKIKLAGDVELIPGHSWICEECGRHHHVNDAVVDIPADSVSPHIQKVLGIPDAVLSSMIERKRKISLINTPEQVRCPDCDIHYRTLPYGWDTESEDYLEDEDLWGDEDDFDDEDFDDGRWFEDDEDDDEDLDLE